MRNRLLAVVAAFAVTVTAFAQPPGGGGPPPAAVRVAAAERLTLSPTTTVPGTVTSRFDARVAAEVTGTLVFVADTGTAVQEGDVVARIENTQLRLVEAEAAASVQRETTRLTFLAREADRLDTLYQDGTVARSTYEQTVNNRDVSRSELAVQQARLAQARDQLGRTEIRASFDGVVAERLSQAGERVSPGNLVVRLTAPRELEIVARAPLASVPFLTEGLTLRVEVGDAVASAVIRTIVPFGDARSHLFEIRLDLPADGDWSAGQAVRVAVPTGGAREVIAVPRDALILRREGAAVFRISAENQAERIPVLTGASDGEMIEVQGMVQAGDRIVVRGGERLRPGQPVRVLTD
ncbi:MAG: efflux RND transporter periplasmic adaptor subunit [Xanthomonadaceae bacterium]|nr:efflux RND transporter periplasmic adaptor subunit [Xanthomonadaceae bacterium]